MLTGALVDEGYLVDRAPDGHRGLHLGLTRPYDVMLIDSGSGRRIKRSRSPETPRL